MTLVAIRLAVDWPRHSVVVVGTARVRARIAHVDLVAIWILTKRESRGSRRRIKGVAGLSLHRVHVAFGPCGRARGDGWRSRCRRVMQDTRGTRRQGFFICPHGRDTERAVWPDVRVHNWCKLDGIHRGAGRTLGGRGCTRANGRRKVSGRARTAVALSWLALARSGPVCIGVRGQPRISGSSSTIFSVTALVAVRRVGAPLRRRVVVEKFVAGRPLVASLVCVFRDGSD